MFFGGLCSGDKFLMTEKKKILILGKTGSGKSYLAKKLLRQFDRVVVYDTMDEYTEGVVFEDMRSFGEFWKRCHTGKFRLIYRPKNINAEFDTIAGLVWDCGNCAFLVEEIDLFGSAWKISDEFSDIIRRGRHKNITFIGVTQRPFGINRLLTSQAKEIYVFNSNEPRDRDYIKQLLSTAQISEADVIEHLDQLKQYEYLKWTDGKTELEIGKA